MEYFLVPAIVMAVILVLIVMLKVVVFFKMVAIAPKAVIGAILAAIIVFILWRVALVSMLAPWLMW